MTNTAARPNVLQIGKFYPPHPGGMETHLELLCTELQRVVNVSVLVSNENRSTLSERVGGVSVRRIGTVAQLFNTSISPGMRREIRASPADIVHIHWPNPTAVLAYLASGHRGKLIVTYHSDIIRQKAAALLFSPVLHALLSRCAAIIVTSREYAETSPVLRAYRNICHVIPFGIRADSFHSRDGKAAENVRRRYGPRLVLAVGRLVYYKGFEFLVQAMRHVDGNALIIGDGPLLGKLKNLSVSCGVADRVFFTGAEFIADLTPYFHAADLFVLPSIVRSEAFGIVQLEAMACGKPVINTRIDSGVPVVSLDGVTGLTVPPGDSESMAAAINKLLNDGALRALYGEAARRRVLEEFTVGKMVGRTCRLYRQVLESRAGMLARESCDALSDTMDETRV